MWATARAVCVLGTARVCVCVCGQEELEQTREEACVCEKEEACVGKAWINKHTCILV